MRTVYITRKEHFNAAHKLYREDWTAEKNQEVFGKCANHNWHGHNFNLYVTVKGVPSEETGFIVDLKKLSTLIRSEIVERLDHKNINLDVEFMKGKMASTENLCLGIWDILNPKIEAMGCQLHCIKLYETENNYAEYFGE
jgi:6-pyruvoyltetrahydropterin/6-carboxytetrahydropterin synthase